MYKKRINPIGAVLGLYFIFFALRIMEYFFIRTDQGFVGEAFIHKLLGILLLAIALRCLKYNFQEIGFVPDRFARDAALGAVLGVCTFAAAYGVEIFLQTQAGNHPQLLFHVTSYSIQGNRAMQDGSLFVVFCIVGNLINVIMEEGVFRGLFPMLAGKRLSFWVSCFFSSLLFGFWHIAQPLRNVIDGQQSPMGAVVSGLLLITTSTLLGVQLCMLNRITGSIWAGMAAHFINNTTINLLHVAASGGIDEMQTLRITIAQTLSFIFVLILFLRRRKSTV